MIYLSALEGEYRYQYLEANWDISVTDASGMLRTLSTLGFLEYETDHSIAFFEYYALQQGTTDFYSLSFFFDMPVRQVSDYGIPYLYEQTKDFLNKAGEVFTLPDCSYLDDNYICTVNAKSFVLWTEQELKQISTNAGFSFLMYPRYCQLFNEILTINHSKYRLYYTVNGTSYSTCMLLTKPVINYLVSIGVSKPYQF